MLFVESPSRSIFLFEHDLFGKPVPTFPDHALGRRYFKRRQDWRDEASSCFRVWTQASPRQHRKRFDCYGFEDLVTREAPGPTKKYQSHSNPWTGGAGPWTDRAGGIMANGGNYQLQVTSIDPRCRWHVAIYPS